MTNHPEYMTLPVDGGFPNSVLPFLVYRGVAPSSDRAAELETIFARNGWTGSWRNGIYDFHHFHSTAHEVLGIAEGSVDVRLGGPRGRDLRLEAGDVVVLPAGTAHCRCNASDNLLVIGAYAQGRSADMRHGAPDEFEQAVASISAVSLPKADPVAGSDGALMRIWRRRELSGD